MRLASVVGTLSAAAVFYEFLPVVLIFVSAGRINWLRGWIYVALDLVRLVASAAIVLPLRKKQTRLRSPERVAARRRYSNKMLDISVRLLGSASLIMAGLDERFGWSSVPFWTVYPGIALLLLGTIPRAWAGLATRSLNGTSYDHNDPGPRLVTTGAYRFVRHPIYLGAIIESLAIPLILGSVWAMLPIALRVPGFVAQTALIDRALAKEIDGYGEYARRTKYRLVPVIW
jgi:protein-S-isoprenylcysteine O-methyltransferase Ste14